jgi:hypothetical protein
MGRGGILVAIGCVDRLNYSRLSQPHARRFVDADAVVAAWSGSHPCKGVAFLRSPATSFRNTLFSALCALVGYTEVPKKDRK